jgi:hypothetical protein
MLVVKILIKIMLFIQNSHLVLTQIYLQTYLNFFMKYFAHLFNNCWNPSYNKLCFNTSLNSFLNYSICCNLQIFFFFQSLILPLFLSSFFDFFYNYLVHVLRIFKYSTNVITCDFKKSINGSFPCVYLVSRQSNESKLCKHMDS